MPYASDIITVANNELGYIGKQGNANINNKELTFGESGSYTKYGYEIDNTYNNLYDSKRNGKTPWNTVFVHWVFIKAFGYEEALKMLYLTEHNNAYIPEEFMNIFKTNNKYYTSDPLPGDIVFLGVQNSDTVEIRCSVVNRIVGGNIEIIECSMNTIILNKIDTHDPIILGYGRPIYSNTTDNNSLTIHITPPYESWPYDALPPETTESHEHEDEDEDLTLRDIFRYNKIYFECAGMGPTLQQNNESSDSEGSDSESKTDPVEEYKKTHYIENGTPIFLRSESFSDEKLDELINKFSSEDSMSIIEQRYNKAGGVSNPDVNILIQTDEDSGGNNTSGGGNSTSYTPVINIPAVLILLFEDYGYNVSAEVIAEPKGTIEEASTEDESTETMIEYNLRYEINESNNKFKILMYASGAFSDEKLPNGTYNLSIYNKSNIKIIKGPDKAFDEYKNMEINSEEFRGMSELTEVHMFNSNLYGDIGGFGECSNLQILDIENTNVSGSLASLSGCSSLTELYASNTAINCELKELDCLPSLEEFHINSTLVHGDISGIATLKKIKRFEIISTDIYGNLSSLSNLTQLEAVQIYNNIVGDISSLSNLSNLSDLILNGTNITGSIESLRNAQLKSIHITNTSITGNISSILTDDLETIIIKDTPIEGDINELFKHNIQYIHIDNTNISGELEVQNNPVMLRSSSKGNIQSLYLSGDSINGDIGIIKNINNAYNVNLSGCNISGDINDVDVSGIINLNLSNLNISGDISNKKFNPDTLSVKISGTNITGDISAMGNLKKLTKLVIYNTNISGDLSAISKLKELKKLNLSNTKIYGNLYSLQNLENLEYVNILEPKIKGKKEDLKNLKNLISIEISNNTNNTWR